MALEKQSKEWLIEKLTSWRDTFDNDGDDSGYDNINKFIKRIQQNKVTKKDYEEIVFHLWQISQGEE